MESPGPLSSARPPPPWIPCPLWTRTWRIPSRIRPGWRSAAPPRGWSGPASGRAYEPSWRTQCSAAAADRSSSATHNTAHVSRKIKQAHHREHFQHGRLNSKQAFKRIQSSIRANTGKGSLKMLNSMYYARYNYFQSLYPTTP